MVKRMDWQACDFEEQDFAYSPVNSSEHQLDKDGVPLAISGECSYRFERMSEKANLMQRYSHWQFRCTKSKKLLNPKTNDVAITLQYKVCAGLIRCSNSECQVIKRPNQNKPSLIIQSVCQNCLMDLEHVKCECKVLWVHHWLKDRCIILHHGIHKHDVPHTNKPDVYTKAKLVDIISAAPNKTAMQLIVGAPGPSTESIRHISPAFGNKGRVAYFRREILKELGITLPGVSETLDQIKQFQTTFTNSLRSNDLHLSRMHVSVASPFMIERLVDQNELTGRQCGGCVSDVTYSFFKNGYLMTSAVYCVLIKRWVPVLYSWLDGLTSEHHRVHFVVLLEMIMSRLRSQPGDFTMNDRVSLFRQLCGAVMDYSKAQNQGFVAAYVKVLSDYYRDLGIQCCLNTLTEDANSLIKGCEVHFINSAERISRNSAIVGSGDNGQFLHLVKQAVREPMEDAFNIAIDALQVTYPNAAMWFEWWLKESVARLVFRCKRKFMDAEFAEKSRNDTNPIEAMHSMFYQIAETKNSMVFGLTSLMLFSGTLEQDFADVLVGRAINYGVAERWKRSIEKCHTLTTSSAVTHRKRQQYENDGRPPDTSKKLLTNKSESKSKLGRPKGSRNVSRDPHVTYQSYAHTNNTCYVTTILECLNAVFDYIDIKTNEYSPTNIFSKTMVHLSKRRGCPENRVKKELSKGLRILTSWIIHDIKLYAANAFGNPFDVLEHLLKQASEDVYKQVSFDVQRTFICHNGHIQPIQKPGVQRWFILNIRQYMVEQSASSSVQAVLDLLLSAGAFEMTNRLCSDPACDVVLTKDVREIISMPENIMLIELPVECASESLMCNEQVTANGFHWRLVARISSTSDTGSHFYAHILRQKTVKIPGWYYYNDLENDGRACYVEGKFETRSLSYYVFYVKI